MSSSLINRTKKIRREEFFPRVFAFNLTYFSFAAPKRKVGKRKGRFSGKGSFLASADACESYDPKLKFPYNRFEGVLRKVERDDDVYDVNHVQRFYRGDKMCVICNGEKFLIANNWFADGDGLPANKRAFYKWLTLQTTTALNKR